METLLLGVVVLLIILLAALVVALLRRPQTADLSTPLQNLTQAVQQGHSQTAVLVEKMAAVSDRVAKVEEGQTRAGMGISGLETELAATGVVAKSIADTTSAIREELSRAKNDLTELQTHTRARQELEQRTADSIKRLETIIAGTQSKGSAGENILEAVFAKLPVEWQVRNFAVGNKMVEFALRLPNNLVLPIDSKWAATNLLEQLVACEDPAQQQELKAQIEKSVRDKAREVRKYIDPSLTVGWGVAAVPDAVYDLCCGLQAEISQMNVVLISYSMFIPYLLLVFQTILKTSHNIDLQKLDAYLRRAQESIKALQEELEGRLSRAITMLGNSRDDMRSHLSKAGSSLVGLQLGAGGQVPEGRDAGSALPGESAGIDKAIPSQAMLMDGPPPG